MLTALIISLSLASAPTGSDPSPIPRSADRPGALSCPAPSRQLRAFDRLDRDADGVLTPSDTRRRHMGRDRGRRDLNDPLHASLDIDGDGRATRAELTRPDACLGNGAETLRP